MPRPSRHPWALGAAALLALALAAAAALGPLGRWAETQRERRAEAAVADSLRTPDDLLAWIHAHPAQASLVVLDGAAVTTAVQPATRRAAAGLPALLLAAELARRADAGLDTAAALPPSAVRKHRLPEVERADADTLALGLAALTRRALGGDRAAADALLLALGREAAEAAAATAPDSLEAPVPEAGLQIAWAPGRRPGETPQQELAAFLRAPRAAQRDSAFARGLALANSPSFRAELADRLRRTGAGLGLTRAERHRAAAATFPHGAALDYARLLAAADPTLLRLLAQPAADSLRTDSAERLGVARGEAPGLLSIAAVRSHPTEPTRIVVLLLSGLPPAVFDHLRRTGLQEEMVRALLLR